MKTEDLNFLKHYLGQSVTGEPMPSLHSPECDRLMALLHEAAAEETPIAERARIAGQLGCIAMSAMLAQLVASLMAERELALARDNRTRLC